MERDEMKVILSRKGFDSGYGGMPSPILPDGRLVPLPIPNSHDHFTLADVNVPGVDVQHLIGDLSQGEHSAATVVHLDPDLDRPPSSRINGWRPTLGQSGNAQSHLRDMRIGAGDVFLFFGWFRQAECSDGHWRFVRGAPNLHVLFGWLEVSEVLAIVSERNACLRKYPWIANHPHVASPEHYDDVRNSLYVAAEISRFSPKTPFGGGRFSHYSDSLRLTKPGSSRSVWSLPGWFMPKQDKPGLSYHPKADRWSWDGGRVTLKSAAKGQEFVLDGSVYPEAEAWVGDLIGGHA